MKKLFLNVISFAIGSMISHSPKTSCGPNKKGKLIMESWMEE
jgi:uncharacterized membrane protein